VLTLQDDVARDIASEIRVKLTPQEESRLAADKKTKAKAYDEYLRGRHLWGQRTDEAAIKTAVHFREAIREDPNFALAYSGLSDCYWVHWGSKAADRTDEYARKAIALRPDLGEGHASLGVIRMFEFRTAEAEPELKLALELNPNYAMAHHFYASYLLAVGRGEDALAENDQGRQLDPFSLPVNFMRAIILTGLRRYDQAVEQLGRVDEISPDLAFTHMHLARNYWLLGKAEEAIAEQGAMARASHSPERIHDYQKAAEVLENQEPGQHKKAWRN
jgi:tetratricopeptide (TPR) repeat protein